MILSGTPYRLLMKVLEGDKYQIKSIPQDSFKYFIDIGANIGLVSILCRLCHPNSKILAIEPFLDSYISLVSNISGLKITSVDKAFGPSGKYFFLEKQKKSSVCNRFIQGDGDYSVQSISLPEINSIYNVDPSKTFYKFDCEGAEKYLMDDKSLLPILFSAAYISIEVHSFDYNIKDYIHWIYDTFLCTHEIKINESIINLRRR